MVDYEFWSKQPSFLDWEAAFLFCDLEPKSEPFRMGDVPQKVKSMYRRIDEEIPVKRDCRRRTYIDLHGERRYQDHPLPKKFKRKDLLDWAEKTGLRPKFLFPEDPDPAPLKNKPLRDEQIDRNRCQAIALTLWDIHPNMKIKDMANHPAILKYGNGGQYKGKKTVYNWVKEVAPASARKPGRPKKEDEKPPSTSKK